MKDVRPFEEMIAGEVSDQELECRTEDKHSHKQRDGLLSRDPTPRTESHHDEIAANAAEQFHVHHAHSFP